MQEHFSCSVRQATAAKRLVDRDDIVPEAAKHAGNPGITSQLQEAVVNFYQNQENAREMPGIKDIKSIKNDDGTRTVYQKKFLLFNIRELHCSFIENFPQYKIGFAKFAMLRPEYCVLAGTSGTHNVCVCTIHQNLKLMLEG